MLETDRLRLRHFKMKDLNDFFAYAKSDKVGPMAGWKPHGTRYESKKLLKNFIREKNVWTIWHKEDDKSIGSIGLHEDTRRDMSKEECLCLGYVLSEDYWGEGYMVEACKEILKYYFEEKYLDYITVYHYDFNLQSKRVIEKLGFRFEGVLRSASRDYKGRLYDTYAYSISREEYLENR